MIHTKATLFREHYVNRLCKTWTAVRALQSINGRAYAYITPDRTA